MELREQIFVKICEASVGIGPEQLDAAKLADAILALPEIRDALQCRAGQATTAEEFRRFTPD